MLPPEITIYHLHLTSHHMAVQTCLTAQVKILLLIILEQLLSLHHVGQDVTCIS